MKVNVVCRQKVLICTNTLVYYLGGKISYIVVQNVATIVFQQTTLALSPSNSCQAQNKVCEGVHGLYEAYAL